MRRIENAEGTVLILSHVPDGRESKDARSYPPAILGRSTTSLPGGIARSQSSR